LDPRAITVSHHFWRLSVTRITAENALVYGDPAGPKKSKIQNRES
jgi:hypothetical protein